MIIVGAPASSNLSLADLEALDPDTRTEATERRFACPKCDNQPRQGDRRALSANMTTGLYSCHRCGASGKLKEHWDERPALPRREQSRARFRQVFSLPPRPAPAHDPDDAEWRVRFAATVPLAGTRGEGYLAGRGIPRELADTHGVRFAAAWYNRPAVVYPLHCDDGVLAAVGVRFIDDLAGTPKPWNPNEKYSKTVVNGRLSYGAFATRGAFAGDAVVIVEGPADALSLALCGVPAVALHQTSAQAWVVRRCAFKRVLVSLDADTSGNDKTPALMQALERYGARPEVFKPPVGKDWNDAHMAWGEPRLREWLCDVLTPPVPAPPPIAGQSGWTCPQCNGPGSPRANGWCYGCLAADPERGEQCRCPRCQDWARSLVVSAKGKTRVSCGACAVRLDDGVDLSFQAEAAS